MIIKKFSRIPVESKAQLQNHVQQKISHSESRSEGEKPKVKEPFKCKACIVYGNLIFTSSNDKEIDNHMLQHIEKSRTVTMIKENIEEEESSLDDSDIYAGFDEYSNGITEVNKEL